MQNAFPSYYMILIVPPELALVAIVGVPGDGGVDGREVVAGAGSAET
jgi:hypothetical protein